MIFKVLLLIFGVAGVLGLPVSATSAAKLALLCASAVSVWSVVILVLINFALVGIFLESFASVAFRASFVQFRNNLVLEIQVHKI